MVSVTGAPPRVESCLVSLVLPVAAGAAHGICCQFGVLETANVALLCRDRLETCNLYELEIRKKEHESVIVFLLMSLYWAIPFLLILLHMLCCSHRWLKIKFRAPLSLYRYLA